MAPVSIAEIMRSLLDGGTTTLAALGAFPAVIGLIAWLLNKRGQERASQLVANGGIAVGLMAIVVLICTLIYGSNHGVSAIEDVSVIWFGVPIYLTVAGFFVEHWVHPGRQEAIRTQIRGGVLIVIVLVVLYWLLSRMRVWMLVHTSVLGLVFFVAALVGILYYLVRKFV